jgi:lipid II:glycine glycyltransferase (peptidoglycan interpeptide bridge formation enzyme)
VDSLVKRDVIFRIEIDERLNAPDWDDFVELHPDGHYEQSSSWAQVKSDQHWLPLRLVAFRDEMIVGGAQILVRTFPLLGKVGYATKAPLLTSVDLPLSDLIVSAIKETSIKRGIRLLIVQAPYHGYDIDDILLEHGFVADSGAGVISATTRVDLSPEHEVILSRMTRKFSYNIRFAQKHGVTVRNGMEEDIPLFFQMMCETCKRQGVRPNPANVSFVKRLWDNFSKRNSVKLLLAQVGGETVSALVGISFGRTFYAWKMGWIGTHEKARANHLLHWEAMKWAKSAGQRFFDFMGINRTVAEAVLKGNHFYSVAQGPALFKLSFGGEVLLLPEARIYINNPVLNYGYTKVLPNAREFFHKTKVFGSGIGSVISKAKRVAQ